VVKAKLSPKGLRDFLPETMAVRNMVIGRLRSVFEKYGFDELQTPAMESQEILLGKTGESAEKLMYLFKDPGGRDVGLRYDLTIPLARVMTENRDLTLPFKRYQIQPVWRAEKPQKGRYRQILHCDIDIVGSASPMADAEILAIINHCLVLLGFDKFKIRLNSRVVLFESMKSAKVPKDKWLTVIQSIDKLDKKSKSEVEKELNDKSLNKTQIKAVFDELSKAKPDEHLQKTIVLAEKLGVEKNLEFDPTLSRGLDYYTGPIFETVVEEPKIGSITGGGRYDTLLKDLNGPDLPATGTSFGLDRIVDVVIENNLLKDIPPTSTQVLVTVFSEKTLDKSIEIVNLLRKSGINSELYTDANTKLEKQLKYADKKSLPWAVIAGPKEILADQVVLKNLKTKRQQTVAVESLLVTIK